MIPPAPLGTNVSADPYGLGAAAGLRPGDAAERGFRFELAAHPGSVAQARQLARAGLSGWSVCEDTCETAVLVVSELVTNAIVHTASRQVVCELYDSCDSVRIAVRDEGCAPDAPRSSPRRPDEEHGRGLLLVATLCRAWGAQEQGPGLVVWAELERSRDTGADTVTHTGAGAPNRAGVPEIRGDLGWGARPRPGPSGGSDDDETEARHKSHASHGTGAEWV